MIEIGQIAPEFSLPRDGAGQVSLSSCRPSLVVLFFYPRDDTAGCTTEALGFSNALDAFRSAGTEVIGISKDSVARHDRFREKHGLAVALASDAQGTTCEDYGVWKEKQMYGKKFMGIERTTVLIGGDGVILKIWRKVRVPGHVDDVLQTVRAL